MSYKKILQLAQDEDSTKDDIVEYIEDLIALRKSNIKYIITKDDAVFQNARIVSLLADALDTVSLSMLETTKNIPFYSPKVLAKIKSLNSTTKAFVKFNDKAFVKPKGSAESGIYEFADLADEFQEMIFKWVDEIKLK